MSRHIQEGELRAVGRIPMMRTRMLCAICALVSLAVLSPSTDAQAQAPGAVPPVEARNAWELEITPLAERFERASGRRLPPS